MICKCVIVRKKNEKKKLINKKVFGEIIVLKLFIVLVMLEYCVIV